MTSAEVGDDVYGEDPTVAELESEVAGQLGQEAALFTVTGSLANVLEAPAHSLPPAPKCCASRPRTSPAELGAHGARSAASRCGPGPPRAARSTWSRSALWRCRTPVLRLHRGLGREHAQLRRRQHSAGGRVRRARRRAGAERSGAASGRRTAVERGGCHRCAGDGVRAPGEHGERLPVQGARCAGRLAGRGTGGRHARGPGLAQAAGGRVAAGRVLAAAGLYAVRNNVERLAEDHANARAIAEMLADAVPGAVAPDEVEDEHRRGRRLRPGQAGATDRRPGEGPGRADRRCRCDRAADRHPPGRLRRRLPQAAETMAGILR